MTATRSGSVTLSARALTTLLGEWEGRGSAYLALADRIEMLVIDGRIAPRTWLPAERELAKTLGRSRTTIVAAYRQLREGGYLESIHGAGSITSLPRPPAPATAEGPGMLDLSFAIPPMWPGLPAVLSKVAADFTTDVGGQGCDLLGTTALRERIAARYTERGLPTSPGQIMVTLGAQHAIGLITRALVSRGDRAVIESPTYPHAYEALRGAGARAVTIPVTTDGWDVEALDVVFERSRPALGYVMPDFHNPTGASMDLAARERLIAGAESAGTILVVDETTAELDIDACLHRPPLAAFADHGADVVLTVGSLGKTAWSGLRIGWIRGPEPMIGRLTAVRTRIDMGTPGIDQAVAVEVFDRMPEILAHRRAHLSQCRELAGDLLAQLIPEWEAPRPAGGLCLWVGLGEPVSSSLALAARSLGLLITAGSRFGIDGAHERRLRIPITADPATIASAIPVLRQAWEGLTAFPGRFGTPEVTLIV